MIGLQGVAHPEFLDDMTAGPRANGAVRVAHGIGKLHLFAVVKEPRAVLDDFCVKRIGHVVAGFRAVIGDLRRAIDGDQQRVKIKVIQMRRAARNLTKQIRPTDDFIHRPRANAGQNLAHFLGVEGDQVHHLIRRAGKFLAQFGVLGADAHGAGVRLALTHHDAAHRDQGGGADAVFLGPHHGGHHHIAAGAQPTIGAQGDAFAQVVHGKNLMRLCQAHFPRQARIFNAGAGRCPRAAIVTRNQDHIRLGLDHARRNRANTRGRHQLHRDLGARVDLFQIVDQLRKVFDGIDIVVRWRRYQRHALGGMSQPRNKRRYFHTGQLTTFAGLGPLGDFDLQLFAGVQVFRRHTKTP